MNGAAFSIGLGPPGEIAGHSVHVCDEALFIRRNNSVSDACQGDAVRGFAALSSKARNLVLICQPSYEDGEGCEDETLRYSIGLKGVVPGRLQDIEVGRDDAEHSGKKRRSEADEPSEEADDKETKRERNAVQPGNRVGKQDRR